MALWLTGCANPQPLQRFEYNRLCMGVEARIVLVSREESAAQDAAAAAFDRLAQLDSIMSDFRKDSELMRLCERSGTGPVKVSVDLCAVLKISLASSHASGGAFDVTVGPAVQLWREARRTLTLPDDESLAAARSLIGWRNVVLDEQNRTVELKLEGMQLDVGGIGKGYAAQQAVNLVKERGFKSCMVALAGDIVVGDAPPGERGWRVEIAQRSDVELPLPLGDGRGEGERTSDVQSLDDDVSTYRPSPPRNGSGGSLSVKSRTLLLANAAVSTSGDAEQFIDINGTRYSHLIDPRTGLGITAQRSVTVFAPRGELADALSSALCVMGPEHAQAVLAEFPGTAAIIEEISDSRTVQCVVDRGGVIDWFEAAEPGRPDAYDGTFP